MFLQFPIFYLFLFPIVFLFSAVRNCIFYFFCGCLKRHNKTMREYRKSPWDILQKSSIILLPLRQRSYMQRAETQNLGGHFRGAPALDVQTSIAPLKQAVC